MAGDSRPHPGAGLRRPPDRPADRGDNAGYQAWMTLKGTSFDPKTWNAYVNTVTSQPIPGAVEFANYAASKGVKVFYVSNRTAEEEPATRKNLEKLGFPMGGDVDTML